MAEKSAAGTSCPAANATNCSRRLSRFLRGRENWTINAGPAAESYAGSDIPRSECPSSTIASNTQGCTASHHVRLFDLRNQGIDRSAGLAQGGRGVAATIAGARRHRSPAAGDARLRGDEGVAQAVRSLARAGHRIPRRGIGRRSPPAHQAIRRELRQRAQARRAHLAIDLRSFAGLHLRLPDRTGGSAAAVRQRALEEHGAAAVCAPDALLRHRRQASRVPLRALDTRQMGRVASRVPARRGTRPRSRGGHARQWRAEHHAVDHRAGIHLCAADPPAQHREHVAAPARLGHRAAAGVEPAPADRRRAALARRILRRHRRPVGPWPAHRQRFRVDAALHRHDAAVRATRPRDRGAAPGRGNRPGSRRADQPAAHRHPREGRAGAGAQPQCRDAPRPPHRMRDHREGAHRALADMPGTLAEGHRHLAAGGRHHARADRGLRGQRRLARAAAACPTSTTRSP